MLLSEDDLADCGNPWPDVPRLSVEMGFRRAAGLMQEVGGYVSLHCNIGANLASERRGAADQRVKCWTIEAI